MIIEDNFSKMNNSVSIRSPISKSSDFIMRFNVEFLSGCQYNCAGCFVNRRNIIENDDFIILNDIIKKLRIDGINVDEIILGPTDFFIANNSIDIITNPLFKELFIDGTVLTLLSTLQQTKDIINQRIQIINESFDNIEIEVLIPIDTNLIYDLEYIENLKSKIRLLDNIKFKVDYALQINISSFDLDLIELTNHIKSQFNTILEFNPSVMRIKNIDRVKEFLIKWNEMLSDNITKDNMNSVVLSSANQYHAGYNERTYTFKNGFLYACPFIYENVIALTEDFKIHKNSLLYKTNNILKFDKQYSISQFDYAMTKSDQCHECKYLASCVAKGVLFYMKNNDIYDCIINKDMLGIHEK